MFPSVLYAQHLHFMSNNLQKYIYFCILCSKKVKNRKNLRSRACVIKLIKCNQLCTSRDWLESAMIFIARRAYFLSLQIRLWLILRTN